MVTRLSREDFAPGLPRGKSPVELAVYARENIGLLGDGGRPAVVICPGGGYRLVAPGEGEPVALAFLAAGVQAFVLRYSVQPDRWPLPLLEAGAAVAYVRRRAKAYGVDPGQVALCGFSAGGHLAAALSNFWDDPAFAPLGLTPEEVRPDRVIRSSRVVTGRPEWAWPGCLERIWGEKEPVPPRLSLEEAVTPRTPPTFLWAATEDATVPVEHSLLYAGALRRAGVPFELHLYQRGPHAMGLATADSVWREEYVRPHAATWLPLALEWLRGM